MAKAGFRVFDNDMHIMEPPDLWLRYIAPEFKDMAPRGITSTNVRDLRTQFPDDPHRPYRPLSPPWIEATITSGTSSSTGNTRNEAGGQTASSR
jgi:hypothetical protein